jgi:hypothetical protein
MIVKMSQLSNEELAEMGECGKAFCETNFSFEKNMQNLENWMI